MLKELRNQHRTIIQMVFSGYKNNEIAERLEMTPCTVSQIVRSPLGQAYLEGLQDKAQEATLDVRKQLVSMNKSALNVLDRLMNPAEKAPHSVQLTAAKDVLDRTGYKAPDRLHVDMTMTTKTDQEIDAEINAMQQSIAKTYLQSPGQAVEQLAETVEPQDVMFIDEQQEQNLENLDDEDMDYSGTLINACKSSEQDVPFDFDSILLNSPSSTSEESISLLSKLPSNLFQN
jgi:DNA-directed RNA polymerase specialized sigma subunit